MSARKVKLLFEGEKETAEYRKSIGMREIIAAYLNCLRCGRKFYSIDKCSNRLCPNCAQKEE